MNKKAKIPQVQSLARALDILELASRHAEGVSLADIAGYLEVSQSAAYNLATTLVSRGYLHKSTRPVRYALGDAVMELAFQQAESSILRKVGEVMIELSLEYRDLNLVFVTPLAHQIVMRLRMDPTHPGNIQRPARPLDNPYGLVTAVCLLALLCQEDRVRIMRRYPYDEFAGGSDEDKLAFLELLEKIRQQGFVIFAEDVRPRAAFPVYDRNEQLVGCLGMSVAAGCQMRPQVFKQACCHLQTLLTGLHEPERSYVDN